MQAINLYGERPYLQPELQEARDFLQATEHSKQLTNAFRGDIQKYWDELESARRKLQVPLPHFPTSFILCQNILTLLVLEVEVFIGMRQLCR